MEFEGGNRRRERGFWTEKHDIVLCKWEQNEIKNLRKVFENMCRGDPRFKEFTFTEKKLSCTATIIFFFKVELITCNQIQFNSNLMMLIFHILEFVFEKV